MEPALSCQALREIDRRAVAECGMLSLVLMENAARGALQVLEDVGLAGPVAICCGRGNNGGDGLALARLLEGRGYEVRVALWGADRELSPDAAANLAILRHCQIVLDRWDSTYDEARLAHLLAGAEWIVDALFGTGFRGELQLPYDAVLRQLNRADGKRLAIDIPSGLNGDTGEAAADTFRADHTVTFVASKPGFSTPGARRYLGQTHVADIGVPRKLVHPNDDRLDAE